MPEVDYSMIQRRVESRAKAFRAGYDLAIKMLREQTREDYEDWKRKGADYLEANCPFPASVRKE